MESGFSMNHREGDVDTAIRSLGTARIDSPVKGTFFVEDGQRVLINDTLAYVEQCMTDGVKPACTHNAMICS